MTALLEARPVDVEKSVVDPRSVLVLSLNRSVSVDDWRRAGLAIVDDRDIGALVAAPHSPDLAVFVERLETYRDATETDKGSVTYSEVFDAIDDLRWFGPADRISERLAQAIARDADHQLDVDIELWYPRGLGEDSDDVEARRWLASVLDDVGEVGVVLDNLVDHEAGVVMVRSRLQASAIASIASLGEIAAIDLAPDVGVSASEADELSVTDLPEALPGTDALPLIAIIDSGVSGSHPLLRPVLYEARTLLPGVETGADECGHGTGVAGIAVFGPTEEWIDDYRSGRAPSPAARVISYRVLNAENRFPDARLWENALLEAVRASAVSGAQIINISIGNPDVEQLDGRMTRCAAILDTLARELGVTIIVPTGNQRGDLRDMNVDRAEGERYLAGLMASTQRALIDPAPAALAITVGGTAGPQRRLPLSEAQLGESDAPSAVTRRGSTAAGALKPELVAPAGTLAWNSTLGPVERKQLKRLLLSHRPDELFARDLGTSFAAPIVTHAAARLRANNPGISSCLTRALLLQSAEPIELDDSVLPELTEAPTLRRRLSVLGHGQVDPTRASFSSDNRAVLVDDSHIRVDSVAIYEVPLPQTFFTPGGERRIDFALAYDPLTRHRRRDYLGSRLFAYLFHGPALDDVMRVLGRATEDELEEQDAEPRAGGGAEEESVDNVAFPSDAQKLGDLDRWRLNLKPSATTASDSANVCRRWRGLQKLKEERGDVALLAIRSTGRWAPSDREDPLGLAIALSYVGAQQETVYNELRTRVTVDVEVAVNARA